MVKHFSSIAMPKCGVWLCQFCCYMHGNTSLCTLISYMALITEYCTNWPK